MGSSEIVDSGKVTGQKSQFSQTCNLLSQFLKKNGSFGDLNNLGIYRNPTGTQAATTTMNLLPMLEKSGDSSADPQKPMNLFPQEVVKKPEQPEKAQMTIFYGGQVIVFDDFPADKAAEIMKLANKGKNNNKQSNFSYPKIQELAKTTANQLPIADLPIARRNSLSRFLEKRKDRLTATAPYQISKKNVAGTPKQDQGNMAWLGLGAHHQFVPVKTEHYF